MNSFHRTVWDAWLNGTLNWNDLDTRILDSSPISVEEKWKTTQEWVLQDPNRFYYPLFGMGNPDSKIAFVATGPGHNAESPWKECNDGAYRERIVGPYKNQNLWLNNKSVDGPEDYEPFEIQRQDWQKARIAGDVDIYKPLFNIERQLNTLEDSKKFNRIYYTNFINVGEFDNNSRFKDSHSDVEISPNDSLLKRIDINKFDKNSLTSHDLFDGRWSKEPWRCDRKLNTEVSVAEIFAREIWLPFLAVELETLRQKGNLEVIVPVGNTANEAISYLYGYETSRITNDALYKKDYNEEVTIIPSIHFSMMDSNLGNINKYDIEDTEDYCSHLAQEINDALEA